MLAASVAVHIGTGYLILMSMNLNWSEVVALTKDELQHGFATFEAIDFTEHDAAVLKLGEKLEALERARPEKLRRQIIRRREFDLADARQAFSAGMSLDGEARHSVPYNQNLLVLSRQAHRDQVAYDALALHTTAMVADGRPLAPELRMFIIDVVLTQRTRPKRSRGYKVETHFRDLVIYWVVEELCEHYGLSASRNDEPKAGRFSACDAIAEAMVALRRRPNSFEHIKDIWFMMSSIYGPEDA